MTAFNAEILGIDIAEIDERLASNHSLPTRFYWDSDIFAFEQEAIFARRWQFFAPVHKVANPGDVAVRQVGKYPIVVTRDRKGKLHGFLNICRHRGYTVAERDQKKCLRLVCRYHAWSYNLDGSLANAPDAMGEEGFDTEKLNLLPVSVEEWGPIVLVHPDPDARSFRETYPVLMATAEETGFDPDPARYTPFREIEYEIDTNWKLWYDNGTECYHCANIHGSSFGDAFNVAPEATTVKLDEKFSSYTFQGNTNPKSNGLSAENYLSF
jgi:phenylpropionate dioxygenase-like ring-hydroxylating dioxygenase large terminal subunit